jgi:hypothetical protein
MIKRAFTEHPASVGESYFQHMGMAFSFSTKMVLSGLACFIHGIFPFLFVCTGRRAIEDLHDRMVLHRDRRECAKKTEALPAIDADAPKLRAAE